MRTTTYYLYCIQVTSYCMQLYLDSFNIKPIRSASLARANPPGLPISGLQMS